MVLQSMARSSWQSTVVLKLTLVLLEVLAIAGAARQAIPPLSTRSRWVVDRFGVRVKLSCVNWAGHMEAGIPEGLSKNTARGIATLVRANGFNCVRLTSATWLWTNDTYGDQSVAENFNSLNITSSGLALLALNPEFYLMSLREVHQRVVNILTAHDLMVILDNHVSKPQWCCAYNDGNGFWGDEYFDVETWLLGLTTVASLFSTNPFVVGMSLRNELRGPRQNAQQWRVLISQAAEAVHDVNPNVLILAGGLSYATNLNFLSNSRGLDTSRFPSKLVYEFHWYKWSDLARGSNFSNASDPDACSTSQSNVHIDNGFLVDQGTPLILSEFGINQGASVDYTENRFLDCVIDYLGRMDLDWAFWALQGSYYKRDGMEDFDEPFGLLGSTWRTFRNPRIVARLQYTIQNSTLGSYAPSSVMICTFAKSQKTILFETTKFTEHLYPCYLQALPGGCRA
jgi:aryl-phospho-beta-D-glucosidase BglC (GH1 family)